MFFSHYLRFFPAFAEKFADAIFTRSLSDVALVEAMRLSEPVRLPDLEVSINEQAKIQFRRFQTTVNADDLYVVVINAPSFEVQGGICKDVFLVLQ